MSFQKNSQQSDLLAAAVVPKLRQADVAGSRRALQVDCHKRTFECPMCLHEESMVVNCGRRAAFDSLDMPLPVSADIDQRAGFRRQSSKLVLYIGVVGFALAGIAFGLTAAVKAATGTLQQTQRERTLLDVRMESAREIRQALAKPVPHPAPLPPVTTRVTRALGLTVVASITPPPIDGCSPRRIRKHGTYFLCRSTKRICSIRPSHCTLGGVRV